MKNFKIFQRTLVVAFAFLLCFPLSADGSGIKKIVMPGIMAPPPPPCSLPIGVTKEMRVDFGAVGDGVTDDSPAFKRASDWINANWSTTSAIKIVVPAGTYLVGHQVRRGEIWNYGTGVINNPTQSYLGVNVFDLVSASNVIIEGAPNQATRIIYKNGMMYGGYRTDTDQPCTAYGVCNNCPGGSDVATVGVFAFLKQCSCISISNFWVEGRYNMCNRQGMVGECGSIQLQYDGILVAGSANVTISDVVCTNFGRDGLMTYFAGGDVTDLTLTNFISSGHGRQGFSLCSGINVNATNCDFILTGNIKDGAIYQGNPGAGLDIEPDQGGVASNCTFTRCRFSRNQSVGMITDNYYPNDIIFDSCFFSSLHNTALWPNRMINSVIRNSVILGRVLKVGGSSATDHLLFENNLFTDWFGSWDAPVKTTWAQPGQNPAYLLNLGGPGVNNFVTFKNNNIEVHHSLFLYFDANVATSSRVWEKNTFTVFSDDLANTSNGYPACFVSNGFLGHFKCCTLRSNTFTDANPLSAPASGKYWIGVKFQNWGPHPSDNVTDGMNYWGPYGPSLYTHFKYNNNWGGGYPFLTGFW